MKTDLKPIVINVPLNRNARPPEIKIPVTEDIPAGAVIRLATPAIFLSDLIAERLVLEDGVACEELMRFDMAEQRKDWVNHSKKAGIITVRVPRKIRDGEEVTLLSRYGSLDYTRGETFKRYSNEPSRPYFAGTAWIIGLELAEGLEADSPRHPISPEVHFIFETGEPVNRELIWKADGSVNVRDFDYCFNPTVKKERVVLESPNGETFQLELSEALKDNSVNPGLEFLPGSRFRIVDNQGKVHQSNALPLTEAGQRVCFGEIHWHTELSSDGRRPLPDALRTARDELCLDFAGPADHIWTSGVFGPEATPEMQVEALQEFHSPDHFAIIPGAEFSDRIGHANFYCDSIERYLEVCRNLVQAGEASTIDRKTQYRWDILTGSLIPGHTFLVPHHSNTNSYDREGVVNQVDGRPFWNAMTFPQGEEMDPMRLFEIYQGRGSFEDEAVDDEWRIDVGGYGASARSALMKGYRIGFTGGTDNHFGWPARKHAGGMIDGFTAVLADSVQTESIWEALYARRCYATTGARIICDVTLNGQPIGSELKLEWDAERKMKINIYGTAPLEKVEVISAGVPIDSIELDGDSWDLETEWEDTRPGRPLHGVYYYLRIRQKDGNIAWLSPFWIDAAS